VRFLQILTYIVIVCALLSCSEGGNVYAPVVEASGIEPIPEGGVHHVAPGDTLYSIAWRYGLDYRSLALRNHLSSTDAIHTGQILYLRGRAPLLTKSPRYNKEPGFLEKEPVTVISHWQWPARGPVINEFSGFNKGINIGGQLGNPVFATAAGKVVYSGDGLRGYGNLIIIKHNSAFLTAYAHNSVVYVREGEWVNAGQKIAAMGKTGTQRVMLHFEIRRNGRPENPRSYLG
jgi:lipoprotein NlpD